MSAKTSGKRATGKTDWARLQSMDDDEIERRARMDLDNPPTPAGWLAAGTFKPAPTKGPISLRVDADILDYFRSQGDGYQSRMNAVLRSFMELSQAASSSTAKRKVARKK